MQKTTYSGSSLEEALKNDSLTESDVALVGMVKSSENSGYICFTISGCDNWIELPIDMIEQAEQTGTNTCKHQSHPVMKITLKEPRNPEAQILLALLSQSILQWGEQHLGNMVPGFIGHQQRADPRGFSYPQHKSIESFIAGFGRFHPWLTGGKVGWTMDDCRRVCTDYACGLPYKCGTNSDGSTMMCRDCQRMCETRCD